MAEGGGFVAQTERRGASLEAGELHEVFRLRGLGRGWQDIAKAMGRSQDLIRRSCDGGYQSQTPAAGAGGDPPRLASGRTARGGVAWSEPPPVVKGAAVPSFVSPPRARASDGRSAGQETGRIQAPSPKEAPGGAGGGISETSARDPSRLGAPAAGGRASLAAARTPLPGLTADLIARAIVAAARRYGDDPAKAMTSTSRSGRRALVAAADALSVGLGLSPLVVAPVLQLKPNAVYSARANASDRFAKASAGALEVVRWHRLGGRGEG